MNNIVDSRYSGIFQYNYGKISNIQINIIESTKYYNNNVTMLGSENYGTIENFVINIQVPIYIESEVALLTKYNRGIIKNGYVYGENIKCISNNETSTPISSIITMYNHYNGVIQNVFSLCSTDFIYTKRCGRKHSVY